MKSINDFIIDQSSGKSIFEKLKLNNQSKLQTKNINDYNFKLKSIFINGDENVRYLVDMPKKEDRNQFIQLQGNDKHFWNSFGPIWILTDWFVMKDYDSEDQLLYAAYRIGKEFNPKITMVEVSWYNEDTQQFETFAISHKDKKERMWHPEWILSEKNPLSKKYPFKYK